MEFNGLPRHIKPKESFIEFSRVTKHIFLNWMINFICSCILFFLYFLSESLPFRPFVFLLVYSYNRTSLDTSAYYTDGVILHKY